MVVHSPPHEQTLGLDKRLQLSSPVLIEVYMKKEEENNAYVVVEYISTDQLGRRYSARLRPLASEHTAYLKTT
jgi:hypothetical protein